MQGMNELFTWRPRAEEAMMDVESACLSGKVAWGMFLRQMLLPSGRKRWGCWAHYTCVLPFLHTAIDLLIICNRRQGHN